MTSAAETDVPQAYPPSAEFAAAANAGPELQAAADTDRLAFWANQAERLHWHENMDRGPRLDRRPRRQVVRRRQAQRRLQLRRPPRPRRQRRPRRHPLRRRTRRQPRHLTYNDLLAEVSRAANTFTDLGLVAGDRVAIYMPMIPEAIVTMLACARLGLTHSVVFAGFSATALRSRIDDAEAKLVVTVDGQWRRGSRSTHQEQRSTKPSPAPTPSRTCLVVKRTGIDVEWTDGRDLWWHETVAQASPEHEAQAVRRRASPVHPLHLRHHR